MSFSIQIDWIEEFKNNPDKWINHGKDILRASCKHKNGVEKNDTCEKCEIYEDSCEPMMNYLYPLELTDFEDDKILKVVKNTNCSVMENQDTGEYFLVLCGGGMDLSQDIALSYVWLERWIPEELLKRVAKQPCLSLNEKNWKELKKNVVEQAEHYKKSFEQVKEDWEKTTMKDRV